MYPAECGEQLGRDPNKIGSSKSLVLKSFGVERTFWDSSLLVSLTLWDTPALFTPPLPLPQKRGRFDENGENDELLRPPKTMKTTKWRVSLRQRHGLEKPSSLFPLQKKRETKTIQEFHVDWRVVGRSAGRHVDHPCGWQISPWPASKVTDKEIKYRRKINSYFVADAKTTALLQSRGGSIADNCDFGNNSHVIAL